VVVARSFAAVCPPPACLLVVVGRSSLGVVVGDWLVSFLVVCDYVPVLPITAAATGVLLLVAVLVAVFGAG